LAKENDVIMFPLVPHTTHALQPLDTAVYGPLKTHWQDVCHEYMQGNPGRVITKYQFNEVLSKVWFKVAIKQLRGRRNYILRNQIKFIRR